MGGSWLENAWQCKCTSSSCGLASSDRFTFVGCACSPATTITCVRVEVTLKATNQLCYRDRSLDQVQAQIGEANRRLAGLVQHAQSPSSWQNRRPAHHGDGRVRVLAQNTYTAESARTTTVSARPDAAWS